MCSYASWRTVEFARLVLQWHYTTFLVLPCIFYPFEFHFCFLPLSSVLCNKCLTVLSVYMFETLCFVLWSMQPAENKMTGIFATLVEDRDGICVLLMDLMWLRLCTAEFGRSRRKNPIWCLPEVIFNSKQLSWVSRIYTTAEALLLTGELSFCGWPTMGSFFSKNNQNCAARIHLLPSSEWRYYTVAFLVPIRQHLCSRREPCPFEIILETAGRVMHP